MTFGLLVRYNQMVPYTKAPQQLYKTPLYTITTYTTLQNMPYDLMRQEAIRVYSSTAAPIRIANVETSPTEPAMKPKKASSQLSC